MKLAHWTLLSVGTLVVLTGCVERGKAVPLSTKKHIKKKAQETLYDFPVLKLSASSKKSTTPIKTKQKEASTNRLLANQDSKNKIKNHTDTQTVTKKEIAKPKIATKNLSENNTTSIHQKLRKENKLDNTKTLNKKTITKKIATVKRKLATHKVQKHKIRKRRGTSSSQIPIIGSIFKSDISLQSIPILNKILPKPSAKSKNRIRNKAHSRRNISNPSGHISSALLPMSFSGGTSASKLDMAKIRVESDNQQTNIVLDSYHWAGYNQTSTQPSAVSGNYFFRYDPSTDRIIGNLKGYNTFSGLIDKPTQLLNNNPLIRNIYIDRYIGDDGIKFIIELKQKVKVNIVDVENPGSIIIELYPK